MSTKLLQRLKKLKSSSKAEVKADLSKQRNYGGGVMAFESDLDLPEQKSATPRPRATKVRAK